MHYSAANYWTPGWTYPRERLRQPFPRGRRGYLVSVAEIVSSGGRFRLTDPGILFSLTDHGVLFPLADPGTDFTLADPGSAFPLADPGSTFEL